jgi:hypothetical protein
MARRPHERIMGMPYGNIYQRGIPLFERILESLYKIIDQAIGLPSLQP